MRFGPRIPSPTKSFKARTTGRIKKIARKSYNPYYGVKGAGWINNPTRATYNKIYNKTTTSVFKTSKKRKVNSNHSEIYFDDNIDYNDKPMSTENLFTDPSYGETDGLLSSLDLEPIVDVYQQEPEIKEFEFTPYRKSYNNSISDISECDKKIKKELVRIPLFLLLTFISFAIQQLSVSQQTTFFGWIAFVSFIALCFYVYLTYISIKNYYSIIQTKKILNHVIETCKNNLEDSSMTHKIYSIFEETLLDIRACRNDELKSIEEKIIAFKKIRKNTKIYDTLFDSLDIKSINRAFKGNNIEYSKNYFDYWSSFFSPDDNIFYTVIDEYDNYFEKIKSSNTEEMLNSNIDVLTKKLASLTPLLNDNIVHKLDESINDAKEKARFRIYNYKILNL